MADDPGSEKETKAGATDPAPSAPPRAPRFPGGGRGALVAAAVVAAVAAVAVAAAAWPLWAPAIFPGLEPPRDPRLGALATRVELLEAELKARAREAAVPAEMDQEQARIRDTLKSQMSRLESVEKDVATVRQIAAVTAAPATAADVSASLSQLSDRLARVETRSGALDSALARLKPLEEKVVERASPQDLAILSKRIEQLERLDFADAEARTGARATVVAVAQLREATRTSSPFAAALEALKAVAPPNPEMRSAIAALDPHAAKGVPTLVGLGERFEAAARRIAQTGSQSPGEGLAERTFNRLRGLVVVRRIGEDAAPGSLDALLAQAERNLRQGDLVDAVRALGNLKGPALEAARDWLAEAEARLAVERAVAVLHVQAVALVAPPRK